MRCLAFTSADLTTTLAAALGRGDVLQRAEHWSALRAAVQQHPWDLIVVDVGLVPPMIEREATFASSLVALGATPATRGTLLPGRPTTHIAVFVPPNPRATRLAIELARAGAQHFVIAGADDVPDPVTCWRSVVESTSSGMLGAGMLQRIQECMDRLPPRVRAAVTTLFTVPGAITSAGELAQATSLTPRSVQRAMHTAGFASVQTLVDAALLLHAWPALRNPLHSRSGAGRAAGLSSYRVGRLVASFTGHSLEELRTDWPASDALLEMVSQRVRLVVQI